MNLRDIIQRLAWKRIAIISSIILILYYITTNNFSCQLPRFRLPVIIIPVPNFQQQPSSPIEGVVTLAMILITIIGIVKLLRQRR